MNLKIAFSMLAMFIAASCGPSGERSFISDPKGFDLKKYQVEDCVVYKFDDGDVAYFMRCGGNAVAGYRSWSEYDPATKTTRTRQMSTGEMP